MGQGAPMGFPGASEGDPRQRLAAIMMNPSIPDGAKTLLLQRMMPPPAEPYTLSPGQVRYGPGGQQEAAVPTAPEQPKVLAPGGTLVGPDGKPIYQAPAAHTGPQFKDVTTIRKEIQDLPSYKSYQMAVPAANSMVESMDKDTRAGDLDFIYALARVFDPNSVVREGEMIMVNNTQSLPNQVVGYINSLNGGERLAPETRHALWDAANGRMQQYKQQLDADLGQFRGIADRYGLNEQDIIPNIVELKTPKPAAAQPPRPAQQQGGDVPVIVNTPEEAAKLPSGTVFRTPDGKTRKVP